jgi:hypothetical protein
MGNDASGHRRRWLHGVSSEVRACIDGRLIPILRFELRVDGDGLRIGGG